MGNFINPKIVLFSMKISPYFNEENFLNISPGYDMRLTWIFAQEHQQQVATAVERAKQVTMTDLNSVVSGGVSYFFSNVKKNRKIFNSFVIWKYIVYFDQSLYLQRPDIARLMQLHAHAQANLAGAVSGPPGLPPGFPNGGLGLPPGLAGLQHGIPTSLSNSLLGSLPTSIAASLGGLGPGPLHPALSMLKPHLPLDHKRDEDVRKSLSESNGNFSGNFWQNFLNFLSFMKKKLSYLRF